MILVYKSKFTYKSSFKSGFKFIPKANSKTVPKASSII